MTLDTRKFLSLLLIPVYLILIALFLILNIGISFNPPILLLVFNTLFLGLIPLYAAYIAYKSFRVSGSNGVLLKGSGMVMIGLGAIFAGVVNYLPNSMNANVTVQNTGFCIGAFLQLIGILIALSGSMPKQHRSDVSRIAILYGGCFLGFSLFSIAAAFGAVPAFFIQGIGFTALREFIITSAIEFFVFSAGVLLWLYYKKHEDFFFWYSIGMALIGLGLLAVHFPSVLGSPLGWIGRSAQYLGGVYLLIAFIALNISAHRTGIQVSEMLSRFFGESETSYKTLIETATDAIVVFDSIDRVIVWNMAAERMFGYTEAEAIGSSFFQLIIPNEFTDIVKNNFRSSVLPEADSTPQKAAEIVAWRKDGSSFPAEIALSRHMVAGLWVSTCIMRDLTERKKAEDALIQKNEDLNALNEEITSTQEELHHANDELLANERRLVEKNENLNALNEELAAAQEELRQNNEELSKAEESIRESEERYRTRFNALIEGFCVIEVIFDSAEKPVDYRFLEINEAFEAQTGLHDAQGKLMRDLAPDHEEHWFEIYGKIAVTGEPAKFENEAKALDRWYDVNAFKIGGQQSRKVGVCFNDITERKRAEEALKESLTEKEVLLSEIHHRVKNNLTAFISLLSLDGSYEDTESGRTLRKDLQNRARSMALIHETLYRTGKFSNVDMGVYLKNLVEQIAQSYGTRSDIKISVEVDGTLSIDRATTAGLIINELVTNSFKYAFPPGFDCMALRGVPCTIRVLLANENGTEVLRVSDNGCGFREGFDPLSSKSLGLKLVNFLSRHQLMADISIQRDKGTEFIFRLKNKENHL